MVQTKETLDNAVAIHHKAVAEVAQLQLEMEQIAHMQDIFKYVREVGDDR